MGDDILGRTVLEISTDDKQARDAIAGIKSAATEMGATGAGATAKFDDGVKVLGQDLDSFLTNPMGAAKGAATNLLTAITPAGAAIAGLAAASAAAGYAIYSIASSAADAMEQLENMSALTGISTDTLEALNQMAAEAGLSNIDFGRTLSKINEELGSGKPGEFSKALDMLGVSTVDSSGKTKDAITVLDEARAALLSINDETVRAQLAQQAFGGRMRDVATLLLTSKQSIADTKEEMVKWGVVTDEMTKNKLRAFDEATDKLGRGVEVLKKYLAGGVMTFLEWNTPLSLLIDNTKKATDEHKTEGTVITAKLKIYDAMKAKKMDEEAKKHAAELKKLREETEKSLRPMEDLADKLKQQMEAGFSKEELIKGYASEIIAATSKQVALTGELSNTAISFYEQADALQESKQQRDAYVTWLENAHKEQQLVAAWDIKPLTDKLKAIDEARPLAYPTEDLLKPIEGSWEQMKKRVPEIAGQGGLAGKNAFMAQVSTIGTDLSKGLVDGLLAGELKLTDTAKQIGGSILRAFTETFIGPFINGLTKGFASLLSGFSEKISGFIVDLFGVGSSAASGAAGAAGGAAGAATSAISGVAGMMGQLVSGAIAAVGAIIGGIITGVMVRKDTQEIEVNTRYTQLRCEGIEGWIRDSLVPAAWEQITRLGNIYDAIEDFKWLSSEKLSPLETIGWSICAKLDDIKNELAALPEAQGGMDYVPRDMLVRVHKGEEIVPPGGVGSKPMTINFNVNAIDARGVAQFMRDSAYPELLRLIGMDRAGARTRLNLALSGRRA